MSQCFRLSSISGSTWVSGPVWSTSGSTWASVSDWRPFQVLHEPVFPTGVNFRFYMSQYRPFQVLHESLFPTVVHIRFCMSQCFWLSSSSGSTTASIVHFRFYMSQCFWLTSIPGSTLVSGPVWSISGSTWASVSATPPVSSTATAVWRGLPSSGAAERSRAVTAGAANFYRTRDEGPGTAGGGGGGRLFNKCSVDKWNSIVLTSQITRGKTWLMTLADIRKGHCWNSFA